MAEPQASPVDAAFARKVRASRITLYFERLWPRLWLILGVAGLFLLVSLLNVWAHLPQPAHVALLAGFAVAALAAVIYAARVQLSRPRGSRAPPRARLRHSAPPGLVL